MALRLISLSCGVLLIAASCAAPATKPPAIPTPTQSAAPIASVVAPATTSSTPAARIASAAEPPLIEPVPLPSPGCTFDAAGGELNGELMLQLDGHPIGTIAGKVSQLHAQLSRDAKLATVQVVTKDLELRADANPSSLAFGLAFGAPPVHGWIELTSARISRCADGKASVSFELPEAVTTPTAVSPAELEVRQLSLIETDSPASGTTGFLKDGARSPIRLAPGGKVVGEVRGPAPSTRVGEARMVMPLSVIERKGAQAHVRIEGDEAHALGWIDSSALAPPGSMLSMLGGLGGSGSDEVLQCPEGAKLLARAGSGIWHVGQVRPGGEVQVMPGRDGSFVVVLEATPLFGGLGVRDPKIVSGELFLPKEEAQRCSVKPPPAPKKK